MRSPGRRFCLAAAAAVLLTATVAIGAGEAESRHDDSAGSAPGTIVLAHAGQLSPKDDCHKQKSAGERHWHVAGTNERGGECVKRDGKTIYMLEMEAPLREEAPVKVKTPWEACTPQWYEVLRALDGFWQIGLDEDVKALMGCLRGAYPRE